VCAQNVFCALYAKVKEIFQKVITIRDEIINKIINNS
jgi:hypothetical protein